MYGFVIAMECELRPFIDKKEYGVKRVSGRDFYYFSIAGGDAVAVLSGVGKVNAAYSAALLLNLHENIEVVFSVGVSGGLGALNIFETIVAEKCVQHDFDTTALGDPIGLVATVNKVFFESDRKFLDAALSKGLKTGIIACGDMIVADSALCARIIENFGAKAVDMESASVAQCALIAGVPFCAVRSISDGADENAESSFALNAERAAKHAAEAVVQLLSK